MTHAAAFAEYFGIRRMAADLLAALYRANSDGLPVVRLRIVCGTDSPRGVATAVRCVRAAMEPGAITYAGEAYALTAGGRAECIKALAECERAAA